MKQWISLLCCMVFCVSLVSVQAAELSETQTKELADFGVMQGDPDGKLRLEDAITRAEAVKMICTAGKLTAEVSSLQDFPDVTGEHWAYAYIMVAKAQGIVVGDENGNFNPEEAVTNEEMVKMLVALLGYEPMAADTGGFPAGFNSVASRLKLTEGMQFGIEVPAIRKDVALMFARALDIPLMRATEEEGMYILMDGNGYPFTTLRTQLTEQ